MGTAPRPWQRTLSDLSVTSKVGIVLLLPVVLASVFAVLRIKDELGTIAQLNTASQQAQIIRPLLDFGSAADDLAVAAGTGAAADTTLDQVSARFDQAAANLQSALQRSQVDQQVDTEVTDALATGRSMRNSLRGSSPLAVGNQSDDVATHISNALSTLTTPQEAVVGRYYTQLGDLTIAHRMFLQQQLLIGSGEISNNPAMLAQALTASGSELTMINQYAVVQPESAYKPDVLLGAQQTRLHALSQNNAEPRSLPGVNGSLRLSTATYADATDHLVDLINSGLSQTSTDARSTVLRDVAAVVLTLLAGLALALAVARSLVVPVRRLRRGVLQVAHSDLPGELSVVREGGATPEILPIDVQTTEEIGQLARAVDDMHRQALHLAADQARLRLLISSMFETLSRRSQSLVEQQLTLIEDLERDEDNPGRLQSLFRLDHLATRMRRNGDNLLVLAGTALRRGVLPPVPLSDMLWSAVSQVEDYQRVEIGAVPDGVVAGEPAVDIEHLLAELIDNSLRYSPPSTPVAVSVTPSAEGGYLIEITDRGLGMSGEDLRAINDRLASGGEVTIETARRMGLYVVGRLAKRHTVTVSLRRTSAMAQQPGITATVDLPASLVISGAYGPEGASEGTPGEVEFATPQGVPFPDGTHIPALSVVDQPVGDLFSEPDQGGVIGFRPRSTDGASFLDGGEPARDPWATPEPEAAQKQWGVPDEPTARNMSRPVVTSWRTPESDAAGEVESWDASEYEPHEYEQAHEDPAGTQWGDARQNNDAARWNDGEAWNSDQRPSDTGEQPAAVTRWDDGDSASPAGHWTSAEPVDEPSYQWGTPDLASTSRSIADPMPTDETVLRPRRRRPSAEPWPSGDLPALPTYPQAPVAYSTDTSGADQTASWADDSADLWAQTATLPVHRPAREPVAESPIYQRMVSEWLVEPSTNEPVEAWSSPADAGWALADQASRPAPTSNRTTGGLPIRNPGAQLVPGSLAPTTDSGAPDPEEIRENLSRHLSGVRSGRASTRRENGYNGDQSIGGPQPHDAQYNDGGHV
ncbi:sensor histidine kinase [Nocardia alni]|uniref:sensor histidine kinase n=1 Tax=Nocardia alni TaxID=2815723 RepID=UPI0020B3E0CF|nr:ATP-binding protein [Nocardia alni]